MGGHELANRNSQTPIITNLATVTGNTTNSYHVVTGATGATLDGFTITAGNANGSSTSSYGGGMYNDSSNPTLADVTFRGNSALDDGGGMRNYFNSNPTLTNVTFSDNSASVGGGMSNVSSSPTLTKVTFSGNSASTAGGMHNIFSNPTLTNVTFSGNSVSTGGGGTARRGSLSSLSPQPRNKTRAAACTATALSHAPGPTRTDTPNRAQALNLVCMPIPPQGRSSHNGAYYTRKQKVVNHASFGILSAATPRSIRPLTNHPASHYPQRNHLFLSTREAVMVHVVCDSSNSLPDALISRLKIVEVLAMVNVTTPQGIKSYRNKVEITIEEFYRILLTAEKLPTTSQPTPQHFLDAFQQLPPGDDILCMTVSAAMSGTFASASAAQAMLPERKIVVWDAKGASMDSGWQIVIAAEMAQQGASLDEILAQLPTVRANTHTFFTTETLKYLAASGRVPRLSAGIGNLLDVKPILRFMHDGTIQPVARVRGRKRSLDDILSRAQETFGGRPLRVAVVNARCAPDAEQFANEVRQRLNVVEMQVIEIGPVLAALAGPGAIGLAAYGQ